MKHNHLPLGVLLFSCLAPMIWAQNAQPTLSLAEALERGLARADFQEMLQGRSALAESAVLAAETRDNPQLDFSWESIDQSGLESEESYLTLSQRFSLFGVRKQKAKAAQHLKNAVAFENQSRMLDLKVLIQESYFEVLYFQKRLQILEAWQNKTEKIVEIIALREQAGQVSGYDRRRLTRALSEGRAQISRDRALHAGSWERLRGWLALEGPYRLSDMLLPPASTETSEPSLHPSLLALDEEIQAATLQERAASRWRLPEMTLKAGLKNTRIAGEKENGVFLAARFPLPVFNRNQAGRTQARARAMEARGEKAWAQARAEGLKRGLRVQIRQMRAAIAQYREEAVQTSRDLMAIAGLAYQEGEMDLLSLLDAYQSSRDAELEMVSMEAETRGLSIELERLGGAQ